MTTRRIGLVALAAMLIAFGSVAVACRGGGGLTLEQYFQRLEALDSNADDQFNAVNERVGDSQDLDVIKAAFPDLLDVIDQFVAGLEDLEPPDVAKDAHADAVDAGHTFRDEFQNVADEAQGTETLDDFFAATQSEAFTAADTRFTDTCNALQQIAVDNNVEVTLNCGSQ